MDAVKTNIATSEEVQEEIENLLHDRFDISEDLVSGEDNFFGIRGLLAPRELTYLSYLLEMQYGIQFRMEDYDDPRFYSISGLSEIVANILSEKREVSL